MIDPTLIEGALDAAAGARLGMTPEQTHDYRMNQLRELRRAERAARAARGEDVDVAALMADLPQVDSAGRLPEDNYYYSEKGAEYGADEGDIATKDPLQEQANTKARQNEERLEAQRIIEGKAREGIFAADDPTFYDGSNNQKEPDLFVPKAETGADGVVRRFMADRQAPRPRYASGKTFDFQKQWRDLVFDKDAGAAGEWVQMGTEPVTTYAPDKMSLREKTEVNTSDTQGDIGTLRTIDDAIISGKLSPVQMEQAVRLRNRLADRVYPKRTVQAVREPGRRAVRVGKTQEEADIQAKRLIDQRFSESDPDQQGTSGNLDQGRAWKRAPGAVNSPNRAAVEAAIISSVAPRGFNARQRNINDVQFNIDSERVQRWGKAMYGPGNPIDRLGYIVDNSDGMQEVSRRSQFDPSSFPEAYKYEGADVYVDGPGGRSLATDDFNYSVRYDPKVSDSNAPTALQGLNAPATGSVRDLMARDQYIPSEGGGYRQVGIANELDQFAERLGGLKGLTPTGNRNVRSVAEAQALLDQVVQLGAEQDVKFWKKGETGKNIRVESPQAVDALARMRYTGPERARLMNALYQLDMASSSPVNTAQKSVFLEGGDYFAQQAAGQPVADIRSEPRVTKDGFGNRTVAGVNRANVSIPGAATPGGDYINFDSPEQMKSYSIANDFATATAKNAPQFRALEGGANPEATPTEQANALEDARRPYVGQIEGQEVGIMGRRDLPNKRFIGNKRRDLSGMAPADVAIAIQAERMRQLKPGAELNAKQRSDLNKNIQNAVEVQERHSAGPVPAPADNSGTERQARIQSVISHANREKPAFIPAGDIDQPINRERAMAKIKGINPAQLASATAGDLTPKVAISPRQEKILNVTATQRAKPRSTVIDTSMSQDDRMGVGRSGISDPPPQREPSIPERSKTIVDRGDAAELTGFYPGITKGGLDRRKAQVNNIIGKLRDPRFTTQRRVGYGATAAAGLVGLAGYTSGGRNQETNS